MNREALHLDSCYTMSVRVQLCLRVMFTLTLKLVFPLHINSATWPPRLLRPPVQTSRSKRPHVKDSQDHQVQLSIVRLTLICLGRVMKLSNIMKTSSNIKHQTIKQSSFSVQWNSLQVVAPGTVRLKFWNWILALGILSSSNGKLSHWGCCSLLLDWLFSLEFTSGHSCLKFTHWNNYFLLQSIMLELR